MNTMSARLTLTVLAACWTTMAAAAPDPFVKSPKEAGDEPTAKGGIPASIEVCYETFSLPMADAAALGRQELTDPVLYERLLGMLEDGKAQQENFHVVRTMSGNKATGEAISEQIYPTEWEPPELPNTIGVQVTTPRGKDAPPGIPDPSRLGQAPGMEALCLLKTPATPTAYDTRFVGVLLEIEPAADENYRSVDLRMALEHVTRVEDKVHGQGLSQARTPEFETQKTSIAQTFVPGVPQLIGTVSRPPVSKVDPDSANTTWFAFVTVRIVLPE